MDYEKKYKEALERARICRKDLMNLDGVVACMAKDFFGEVFPELKESEDEKSKNWILEYLYDGLRKSDEQFKNQFKCAIAWLEKQGEQKTADEISPKFKVGDWIINNDKRVAVPTRILKISNCGYVTSSGYTSFNKVKTDYHLWTIQDAKDGDVLAFYSEYRGNKMVQVGIIEKYVGKHGGCSNTFKIYVGVNWDNNLQIGEYMGCSDIRPATKEQRDFLLQKIKEAGYEWDAEKKELKKIDARENLILDGDLMQADCMVVEQKSAWNEEDEKNLRYIGNLLYSFCPIHGIEYEKLHKWLKSLKDRVNIEKQ